MTERARSQKQLVANIAALAAIVWVAAATLHEGLGHGLACVAVGGDPISWSTFHFNCGKQELSLAKWRIVSAAGTAVNVVLMALGYACWHLARNSTARLAAWMLVVVNGLTSFGYLLFSAAFGFGDWNSTGVMAGISNTGLARTTLGVIGLCGYYAVVRLGAAMLSQMLEVHISPADARRLCTTVWMTIGMVSLLSTIMAGADWRTTLGAAIGAALGGNAGLLSIYRFLRTSAPVRVEAITGGAPLWAIAIVCIAAFAIVLGPGLTL